MNSLFLHVKATPLEFDPFAGMEGTFGGGIQGTIPTEYGAPVRYTARLDPASSAVVLRIGEAQPEGLTVPLTELVAAWVRAKGRVSSVDPEAQPDYAAAFSLSPRAIGL